MKKKKIQFCEFQPNIQINKKIKTKQIYSFANKQLAISD